MRSFEQESLTSTALLHYLETLLTHYKMTADVSLDSFEPVNGVHPPEIWADDTVTVHYTLSLPPFVYTAQPRHGYIRAYVSMNDGPWILATPFDSYPYTLNPGDPPVSGTLTLNQWNTQLLNVGSPNRQLPGKYDVVLETWEPDPLPWNPHQTFNGTVYGCGAADSKQIDVYPRCDGPLPDYLTPGTFADTSSTATSDNLVFSATSFGAPEYQSEYQKPLFREHPGSYWSVVLTGPRGSAYQQYMFSLTSAITSVLFTYPDANTPYPRTFTVSAYGNCAGPNYVSTRTMTINAPPPPCHEVTPSIQASLQFQGFGVADYEFQSLNIPSHLLKITNTSGYQLLIGSSEGSGMIVNSGDSMSGATLGSLYGSPQPAFPLVIWCRMAQIDPQPSWINLQLDYQLCP